MDLEDHEEEDMEIVEPQRLSNYIHKTHPLPRLMIKNPSPVHSNRPHLPSKPMIYNYNYKECLKNHAVAIGGHALDGCGEFMPGGPHGSLNALKCAACNCHRNFHRRDITDDGHEDSRSQYIPYWRGGTMLALPSPVSVRKRVRTKFTEEQKEKMVEMAEKLDWRIQKKDEAAVMEFCNEIGVKRRVLKVWMHTNKNTFRKESQQSIFS